MKISKIRSLEVLDSRGSPTVECEVALQNGICARAIVPSGMSTGSYEALELRDGGKRFWGKGVRKAVGNIEGKIEKKIIGLDPADQDRIDAKMLKLDGTPNKSKLGANAILAVSMAVARAAAAERKIELFQHLAWIAGKKGLAMPVPFANIINGGVHAGTGLGIQEFMIAPIRARSFSKGLVAVAETYQILKARLKKKFGPFAANVGDEGGFAPPLKTAPEAIEFLLDSIEEAGYGKEVKVAMDCAASEFFRNGKYSLDGRQFGAPELIDYYTELMDKFGIISIEDPFAEDEWESFFEFTRKMGGRAQVVGDDLTVTNAGRIREAARRKCVNCLLLKVNQIGTLSESIFAAKLAVGSGWNVMVSHRSGETEDAFISDLAVALECRQIKLGAPARGERTSKYNRLLRIERMLGSRAKYSWVK